MAAIGVTNHDALDKLCKAMLGDYVLEMSACCELWFWRRRFLKICTDIFRKSNMAAELFVYGYSSDWRI